MLDVCQNAFGNARAECIHRRIVDRDDGHVAVFRKADKLAHFTAPFCLKGEILQARPERRYKTGIHARSDSFSQESHAMHNRFDLHGEERDRDGSHPRNRPGHRPWFCRIRGEVTICGRKQETVDAALKELASVKDKVHGVVAHVGKSEDIEQLVAEAEKKFGPVNVLVNNAGTNPYFGPILESDERAWDKTFEVNLKGPYVISRLLAKKMSQSASSEGVAARS